LKKPAGRNNHSQPWSYLCSSSPLALFGLGSTAQVEAIVVTWPDGTQEVFPGGAADRFIELRKGEGHRP
jgi:hypothetical protein